MIVITKAQRHILKEHLGHYLEVKAYPDVTFLTLACIDCEELLFELMTQSEKKKEYGV